MTYSLGIDVGTTYTGVATASDGRAEIFSLGHDRPAAPTVVVIRESGEILVGEAAERRALGEADRTAREFKRRIGDPTPMIVGGTPYGVDALFGHVLRWVYGRVVEQQGQPPVAVTLTHPASWSGFKTEVIRQAARLGGLPAVDLLSEPEAAALHNAAAGRVKPGNVVAVYDFGGGTLDVALVRASDSGFEIVGEPEGIERLGGLDFDQAVFSHVDRSLDGMIQGLDTTDQAVRSGLTRLRTDCRYAKEALSSDTDTLIPVLVPGLETEVRLTRGEFEAMIRPRIVETVEALRRCIASASLQPNDLDSILLVGGSSRIPLVSQMLDQELGRPVVLDAHPKFTIALGAAVQPWTVAAQPSAETPSRPDPAPAETPSRPDPAPAETPSRLQPAHRPGRPDWAIPSLGAAALVAIGLVIALVLMGRGPENSASPTGPITTEPSATPAPSSEPVDQPPTTASQSPNVVTTATTAPPAAGATANVTSIASSDGVLRIEVPTDWSDIDTSPFVLFTKPTAHVSAAPSLSGYTDTWVDPGITVSLVDPLEGGSAETLMASVNSGFGYDTACLGSQSESYDDGRVSGLRTDWFNCGGTSTTIRVIVGIVDGDPTWLLLSGVQAPDGDAITVLDNVLATIQILG